jgi:hypothetical protein
MHASTLAGARPRLVPELVQEDDGAVALGSVARNLPQRLAHQARLRPNCAPTAHFKLEI